ncbi:probable 28S ribosomal protein S23, mitochondrial [Nilaparvata lugens]|uniref:probable 28S ribosomal protein S23, mitochondrial n=1 Tax=Nilaparvata lugens TaxID=108931 RepID=UPI00193E7057|nr:probable 28S ribosomal protein S23, mitochondrial [Nilaparvata lugens]
MAGSRLEKIGTIFTRATGLMRSKALQYEDRPLWYDIYKSFPPTLQPKYDRQAPDTPIRNIFYVEDQIRAKFHKQMGRSLPNTSLYDTDKRETVTKRFLDLYYKHLNEKQMSPDEAFQSAFDILKAEKVLSKPASKSMDAAKLPSNDSILSSYQQAKGKSEDPVNVNLKNIFKE